LKNKLLHNLIAGVVAVAVDVVVVLQVCCVTCYLLTKTTTAACPNIRAIRVLYRYLMVDFRLEVRVPFG